MKQPDGTTRQPTLAELEMVGLYEKVLQSGGQIRLMKLRTRTAVVAYVPNDPKTAK